jgi:hypothetical protein
MKTFLADFILQNQQFVAKNTNPSIHKMRAEKGMTAPCTKNDVVLRLEWYQWKL